MRRALHAAALLACAGCDDPLARQQDIDTTRVLGARVEVAGDPDRAWPAQGETATVRWLVAQPREDKPLDWRFLACAARFHGFGTPECAAPAFATAESGGAVAGEPAFTFDVPSGAALGGASELAVHGAVCTGGRLDEGDYPEIGCAGPDADHSVVSLTVGIADDESNQNPSLADDRLELDGAPWLAPPAPLPSHDACLSAAGGDTLPTIAAGSGKHEVRVVTLGLDREPIADPAPNAPERETLQLSHFSNRGALERAFSHVEADDDSAEPSIDVSWRAPKTASAEGTLVRFYFVARDGRGGSDFTDRALCLVP